MDRELIEQAAQYATETLALLNRALEIDTEPTLTLYSQRDPEWRDEEYAPGYTFGAKGCLVTCVAMIASYAGYTDTPPQIATMLREQHCFVGGNLSNPQYIPIAYPALQWDGAVDWRKKAADLDALRDYVNQGPTVVEIEFVPGGAQPPDDQHFVIALDFEGDDLWIADPWDGSETLLLERYVERYAVNWNLARAIYGARLLRVKETY